MQRSLVGHEIFEIHLSENIGIKCIYSIVSQAHLRKIKPFTDRIFALIATDRQMNGDRRSSAITPNYDNLINFAKQFKRVECIFSFCTELQKKKKNKRNHHVVFV